MRKPIVRHLRRTSHRVITASVLLGVVVLGSAGCQYGYWHACDNHGGIRIAVKGIYYCNDGHAVGSGWLLLHHKEVAP